MTIAASTNEESTPDCERLVGGIEKCIDSAQEEFCRIFSEGIRWLLLRKLQPNYELDDKVQDVLLRALLFIRSGKIQDARKFPGIVHTIVSREVANSIHNAVRTRELVAGGGQALSVLDNAIDQEAAAMRCNGEAAAVTVFNSLPDRNREVLRLFYQEGQSADDICQRLELTSTQFRLIKSRTKARVNKLLKNRTKSRVLSSLKLSPQREGMSNTAETAR